jgi:hypothetical protein
MQQQPPTFSVSQPAEVSNPRKTFWQYMLQEAAKEFFAGEAHRALLAVVGVIFPSETDLRFIDGENPMVGNGDAMGITSQVLQDVVWTAKGWLGINDPNPAETKFARIG